MNTLYTYKAPFDEGALDTISTKGNNLARNNPYIAFKLIYNDERSFQPFGIMYLDAQYVNDINKYTDRIDLLEIQIQEFLPDEFNNLFTAQ